jgi:amidase/aspartyl-tRNA(Asn)/glutamyl-tRNA(Gln) amidotransferase subunit A
MRSASGLPIAVQVIAPPWREDLAFDAARRLEEAQLAWCAPPPVLLPVASGGAQ